GQRRADAVSDAHEEMTGLVREEDRHERRRVRQASNEERRPDERIGALLERAADRRRQGREHEQQDIDGRKATHGDRPGSFGDGVPCDARASIDVVHVSITTGSPTRAPRVARADPSRTATSTRPQLLTTATGSPDATAA